MARLTESELVELSRATVETYDGMADDFKVFLIQDDTRHIYVVTGIPDDREDKPFVIVQAHIEGEYVVIDADTLWDKNLWKALEKAGVPREQIILAYRGEKLPESVQP